MNEELMRGFKEVADDPRAWLTKWKEKTGKKIVGVFPMYIPEEIIHAAGMLPVVMLPNTDPVTVGDEYMHRYICHPVRGCFDMTLKGEFDYLDGMVFSDYCMTVRIALDTWLNHNNDCFCISIFTPFDVNASYSDRVLRDEFGKLKSELEKYTGKEITEKALMESIIIYEENRQLLRELYDFRKRCPGALRARDYLTIVVTSMLMPKEEHNMLLRELLKNLEDVEPDKEAKNKVHLYVSGSLCEMPMMQLFDMAEEFGAIICDDDLYIGTRYFQTPIDLTKKPMAALSDRYMIDVPCPTKKQVGPTYGEYIATQSRLSGADGVVLVVLKYCEAHQWNLPIILTSLDEKKVSHLVLESADGLIPTEQMRTRLQAFVEMHEERRAF